MSPFDAATAVTAVDVRHYTWDLPDGWQQGRGAWGGLATAALLRAILAAEQDVHRTVRSVTVQMMAPAVVGSHVIEVSPVRIGSAMSTWSARATDGQGVAIAVMTAILGSPRTADENHVHADWGMSAPPDVPAFADLPTVPAGPPFPVFVQHLAVRPAFGLPMSGGPAETAGWVDYATPTPPTAVSLLALVDGWWPASFPRLSRMPRIATVSFTANLLVDPSSLAEGEPRLYHSFVSAAHEGFTSEVRRLWSADGRLIVDNLQTIVVGS